MCPAPNIKEKLEWMLLTNTDVNSVKDALRVIKWYTVRWQVESAPQSYKEVIHEELALCA